MTSTTGWKMAADEADRRRILLNSQEQMISGCIEELDDALDNGRTFEELWACLKAEQQHLLDRAARERGASFAHSLSAN